MEPTPSSCPAPRAPARTTRSTRARAVRGVAAPDACARPGVRTAFDTALPERPCTLGTAASATRARRAAGVGGLVLEKDRARHRAPDAARHVGHRSCSQRTRSLTMSPPFHVRSAGLTEHRTGRALRCCVRWRPGSPLAIRVTGRTKLPSIFRPPVPHRAYFDRHGRTLRSLGLSLSSDLQGFRARS